MGETIEILRQNVDDVDDYGNATFTQTSVSVSGCLIGWGTTNEPSLAGEDPVTAQATLYMPAGTVVEDQDSFVIRGEEWVKDGHPMAWSSMLNVAKGVVVIVRRRNG